MISPPRKRRIQRNWPESTAVVTEASPAAEPAPPEPAEQPVGALAPLALPTYRMFWVASLFSNTGTWVHEIGAGWLMSTLDGSPQMVAAVRAAMALPMVLLAIPAGALSDRVDRRRLMLSVQCVMMATAASIALLTYLDRITPIGLLALTIVMGLGAVLHVPTWQASIPELVPRNHLPQAIALGSVSFNLARSVGPALGGMLIAVLGTWAAFGVNAVSFAVVLLAIFLWKRPRATQRAEESFVQSMCAGVAMVLRRGAMRQVLGRVVLFVLPASSLWALLPLIAREQLNWTASGYGYLVGAIGVGAVLAALWLPRLRARVGVDPTLSTSMLLYAAGLALLAATNWRSLGMIAAMLAGIGWMSVMTTLNSTAQMTLPDAMRARGMSSYLSAMSMAMAGGAVIWGQIASRASTPIALGLAAATLAVVSIGMFGVRLRQPRRPPVTPIVDI